MTRAMLTLPVDDYITPEVDDATEELAEILTRHGVRTEDVETFWTPGSFEIPVLTKRLAGSGRYAAVICLGAVIRGGTDHYQYIASEVTKGVAVAALDSGVPCVLGVLTCDTIEQAIERAGTKAGNKGADAAGAAIEMADLYQHLPSARQGRPRP